jgi:S1-C subfamily serine protease
VHSGRVGLAMVLVAVPALSVGCGGADSSQATRTTVKEPIRTEPATTQPTTTTADASFPKLVSRVRSGVVRIEVNTCAIQSVGTGMLITPRLVATVEHVVEDAATIAVKRNGKLLATGTVIGTDPDRDLALLQLSTPVTGYRFAFAARAPQLGEAVAALGFPLGLPLTVTRGSVSGLNRTIPIQGLRRRKLVQTDAALNPGNSGGPLISAETGEVLGLVDLGSLDFNGIAFAVSAEVAGPLITAWSKAPQPIRRQTCADTPNDQRSQTTSGERGVGVPTTYLGRFTSVDRLQRCNATPLWVYCSSGPSGRAVRLDVGSGVTDFGIRGSSDEGGNSMPEGTSFRTPDGRIECGSSGRGITCTDRTTGAYFILGDTRLITSGASRGSATGGLSAIPSVYSGYFAAVDRLERCFADDSFAVCTAGPSGKGVRLVAGQGVAYEGLTGSTDKGGPAMPIGSSFATPSRAITCSSSSRGITCRDSKTGAYFTIGDRSVRINNGSGEVVY